MSEIELPVSLGEALDKLTILDIKKEKIKDERYKDVEYEYSLLHDKLRDHINNNNYYYRILKMINLNIWDMQDDFRYNNKDKNHLCLEIIEENDRRFRVKKKINDVTKSNIKEQKGYKLKKALVLSHQGLGDIITSIGLVRYLSTCYDEVLVLCKNHNMKNIELFYEDDPSISFFTINKDAEARENLHQLSKNYSIYKTGYFKENKDTRIDF